jgi:integrase
VSDWNQCGENLVRHVAGTIYLRAKVDGKIKRVSLRTKDLRIAKLKRDEVLASMRKAASLGDAAKIKTLGDAIDALKHKVMNQADTEATTKRYYGEIFTIMNDTLDRSMGVRNLSHTEAITWWRKIVLKYAPLRANNVLGMAKRLSIMLIALGLRIDNPFADLRRKKIPEMEIHSPSREEMENLIADIRGQKKAHSQEAANFVAFLAFSGCRIGQARALCWSDVGDDWIVFRSGVPGTKGAATRRLPISPRLRESLDSMTRGDGMVFTLKNPHEALTRACKRMELAHLRIHDLRHFFATYAMECGVDVRTLAGWLGHKDGGVLLLRRYAHVRDSHSLSSASKLG